MTARVDVFTTVHKGVRALLFDAALAAARVDVANTREVDALVERVERMLAFLEEHEQHEDVEVVPLVRRYDTSLAATLDEGHVRLASMHHAVERTARALERAPDRDRRLAGHELARAVNRLVAEYLTHLDHEETVVNAVLWGSLGDTELVAIRRRIHASLSEAQRAAWREVLAGATDPDERALVIGCGVE